MAASCLSVDGEWTTGYRIRLLPACVPSRFSPTAITLVYDFTTYNGNRATVARLNADGTLDTFNPQSGFNAATTTVALQTDGKIVVGGSFLRCSTV